MSDTAAPYGAQPTDVIGASGFNAKTRQIKIASGYDTAIFYGDFVKLVSSGTVEKDAGTTTMTPVGIFMGCFYTDPTTKQPTYAQHWPADTVADDAVAYVLDDPSAVFRMQADGSLAQTALGTNVAVVQTAGSTDLGRSKNAVDASSSATTNTLPLRIVGFVDGPDSAVGDDYTDVLVTYNAGHQYESTTGV